MAAVTEDDEDPITPYIPYAAKPWCNNETVVSGQSHESCKKQIIKGYSHRKACLKKRY